MFCMKKSSLFYVSQIKYNFSQSDPRRVKGRPARSMSVAVVSELLPMIIEGILEIAAQFGVDFTAILTMDFLKSDSLL